MTLTPIPQQDSGGLVGELNGGAGPGAVEISDSLKLKQEHLNPLLAKQSEGQPRPYDGKVGETQPFQDKSHAGLAHILLPMESDAHRPGAVNTRELDS